MMRVRTPVSSSQRRLSAAIRAMAVVVAVSACGSTAQWEESLVTSGGPEESLVTSGGPAGVEGDEFTLADPSVGSAPGLADDESASGPLGDGGTSGAPAARDGGETAIPGRPGSSELPAPPPKGESGQGFTAKEIYVGIGTHKGGQQMLGALGFTVNLPDQEKQAQAIINDINSRGGVAGRKLVPVFHDYSTQEAQRDRDPGAQRACEHWTEDRPVFAVIGGQYIGDPTLVSCLAQRRTPYVSTYMIGRPQVSYQRSGPYLLTPNDPSLERHGRAWIRRTAQLGYFKGGWDADPTVPGVQPTKVGLLTNKNFYGAEFRKFMREELPRLGQKVVAEAELTGYERVGDEMAGAVAQFKGAGVTHVVSGGGGVIIGFAPVAEQQRYRPRYAISSYHLPYVLVGQSQFPNVQLVGAVGAGFQPNTDIGREQALTTAGKRCQKLMTQAGQGGDGSAFVPICDGFNFFTRAVDKVGLVQSDMQQAAQLIGSMEAVATFRIMFQQGRTDGPAALRDLAYREECDCMMYTSSKNRGM